MRHHPARPSLGLGAQIGEPLHQHFHQFRPGAVTGTTARGRPPPPLVPVVNLREKPLDGGGEVRHPATIPAPGTEPESRGQPVADSSERPQTGKGSLHREGLADGERPDQEKAIGDAGNRRRPGRRRGCPAAGIRPRESRHRTKQEPGGSRCDTEGARRGSRHGLEADTAPKQTRPRRKRGAEGSARRGRKNAAQKEVPARKEVRGARDGWWGRESPPARGARGGLSASGRGQRPVRGETGRALCGDDGRTVSRRRLGRS